MLLALFEPEIPANAGNIARLCAASGTPLHLIGRLGFSFRHPDAKRAGMDYWRKVELHRHVTYDDFTAAIRPRRVWGFSAHAERSFWEVEFARGDVLLFGPESRGLPEALLTALHPHTLHIPMLPGTRSLNLSSAAAVALYEALRQTGGLPTRE